jgi:AraC-like DNA-binding protein
MRGPHVNSSFYNARAGWRMEPHQHELIEISIVVEGQGTFEVGENVHPIQAGHIVLIPENVLHTYTAQTDMRFCVIEAGDMPDSTQKLFRQFIQSGAHSLRFLSPIFLNEYESLFRHWLRTISQQLKENEITLVSWINVILLFIIQNNSSAVSNLSVARSADYIRSHLQSELSVAVIARQCGLSEQQYRVLFKENYGLSPKQYQQLCREEESMWMLRFTDRSIQQIALDVGFSTIHAFSSWFQKKRSMSPSAWRKLQRNRS